MYFWLIQTFWTEKFCAMFFLAWKIIITSGCNQYAYAGQNLMRSNTLMGRNFCCFLHVCKTRFRIELLLARTFKQIFAFSQKFIMRTFLLYFCQIEKVCWHEIDLMSEFHKNPAIKGLCPTLIWPILNLVTAINIFCMILDILLSHTKSFKMIICEIKNCSLRGAKFQEQVSWNRRIRDQWTFFDQMISGYKQYLHYTSYHIFTF